MFSLRIVTVDYYLTTPVKGFDVTFSDFRGAEVYKVPVIRIFGVTPAGQKGCLHVHGVFPYLSVPYDDDLPVDPASSVYRKYSQELAYNIDKALNVASRKSNSNRHHVYKITLESRIPYYGYHEKEQPFLKIFFYNPVDIKKTMELLSTGLIMNKVIQSYEAHVPYTLQFFIDYNLFGMNLINVDSLKFRIQHEISEVSAVHLKSQFSGPSCDKSFSCKIWDDNALKCSEMVSDIKKQTSCELEADCCATYILNHRDAKGKQGENPGLREIWEEERQRRRERQESSQITPAESQERSQVLPTESDTLYKGRLKQILSENKTKNDESTSNIKDGGNTSSHEEEMNSSLSQDSMIYSQDKDMLSMVLSIINSESYQCDEEEDSILSCRMQKPDEREDADETLEMSSIVVEEDDIAPECGFPLSASPNHEMYDENNKKNGSSSVIKKSQELNNPPDLSPCSMCVSEEEEDFKISQLDGTDDTDDFLKPKFCKSKKILPLQLTITTKEEKLETVSVKTNNLKTSKKSDKVHTPLEDGTCETLEHAYSQHSVSDSFNEGKKIMCLKKIGSRATDSHSDLCPEKQRSLAISPPKKFPDSRKPSSRLRRKTKYLPISGLTLSPSKSNSNPPMNNNRGKVQSIPVESCEEQSHDTYCSNAFSMLQHSFRRNVPTCDIKSDLKLCSTRSNNSILSDAVKVAYTNECRHDLSKRNCAESVKLYSKSHKSSSHRKTVQTGIKKNRNFTFSKGNIPSNVIIPMYAKQFDLSKIGYEKVVLTKITSQETTTDINAVGGDSGISVISEEEHTTFKSSASGKARHVSRGLSENKNDHTFQNCPQKIDDNFHRNCSLKINKPLNSYQTFSASNEDQNPRLIEVGNKNVCSRLSLKRKHVKPVKSPVLKIDSPVSNIHLKNRQLNCEGIIAPSEEDLNTGDRNLSCNTQPPESQIPVLPSSSGFKGASTEIDLLKLPVQSNNSEVRSDCNKVECNSSASDDKAFLSSVSGDRTFLASALDDRTFLSSNGGDRGLVDSCRNYGKSQPLSECQTLLNNFLYPKTSEDTVLDQNHSVVECFRSFDNMPENKATVLSFRCKSSESAVASDKGKQEMSNHTFGKQTAKKRKVTSPVHNIQFNYNSHENDVKLKRSTVNRRSKGISSGSSGGLRCKKMYSNGIQKQSKPKLVSSSSTDKHLDTFSTKSEKKYLLKNCKVVLNRINIEEETKCESFSGNKHPSTTGKAQVFQPLCITTDVSSVKPVTSKSDLLNFPCNSDLKSDKICQSAAVKLTHNVLYRNEEYQDVLYKLALLSPCSSRSDPSTSPPRCWSPNSLESESLDAHNCRISSSSSVQDSKCENLHEDMITISSHVTTLNNHLDSDASDHKTLNDLLCIGDSESHVRCSFNDHCNKLDSQVTESGVKRNHSELVLYSNKQDSVRNLTDYLPSVFNMGMSCVELCETNTHKSYLEKGHAADILPQNSMSSAGSKEIKSNIHKDFRSQNILCAEPKINSENCRSSLSVINPVQSSVCVPNYILHDVQEVLDYLIISVDKIINEKVCSTISKVTKNYKNVPKTDYNSIGNCGLSNKSGDCQYVDKYDSMGLKETEAVSKLKSKEFDSRCEKRISREEDCVSIDNSPESLELFASSGSETGVENKQILFDSFQASSPSVTDLSPESTKDEISVSASEETVKNTQNTLMPCPSKNVPFIKEKVACSSNEQLFLNKDLFKSKNFPPMVNVNCLCKSTSAGSLTVTNSEVLDPELQNNETENRQPGSIILEEKKSDRHSILMAEKSSDFRETSSAQNLKTKVPKSHSHPIEKCQNHGSFVLPETKDSLCSNSLLSSLCEKNPSKLNAAVTVNQNTVCSATNNQIYKFKHVPSSSSPLTKESLKAEMKSDALKLKALQLNAAVTVEKEKTITDVVGNHLQLSCGINNIGFEGEMEVTENEDSIMGKSKPCHTLSDLGVENDNICSQIKASNSNENNLSCPVDQATSKVSVKETDMNETVSHEKSFELLSLPTNHPVKTLSESDSYKNDHLEYNLTAENSMYDEAPLQSFYNYQSLTLQNCSEWNDSKISTTTKTPIAVRKSFVLQPKCKPPTREEIENSCELYDIPETGHQEAFFSNPLDIPGGKTLMGHIPRVKSTKTSDLLDFDTKFQTSKINVQTTILAAQPKVNSSNPSSSFHLLDAIHQNPEMKVTLAGNRLVVLTPACFPPSRKKVEEWVRLHRKKTLPQQETSPNRGTVKEDNSMELEESLGRKSTTGAKKNQNPEIVISHNIESSLKLNDIIGCHEVEISPLFPLTKELNLTPNKSLMEYRHFKKSLHSVSTPLSQSRFKKFHQQRPSLSLQNCQTVKLSGKSNGNNSQCESPSVCTSKGNSPLSPIISTKASVVQSVKRKRKLFENNDSESMKLSPKEYLKTDRDVCDGKILSKAVSSFAEQNNSSCSQIEGPSYENTGNYKVNLGKIGDARSVHMNQFLTIMSVEIHVNTRNDLRPNPEHDAVCAVFYYIYNDVAHGHYLRQEVLGVIVVEFDVKDNSADGSHTENTVSHSNIGAPSTANNLHGSRPCGSQLNTNKQSEPFGNDRFQDDTNASTSISLLKSSFISKVKTELVIKTGVANVTVTSVHDEMMLFKELSKVVERWDPDILVGYEIQMLSWGYLLQRASHLKINLLSGLSRIQESENNPVYDTTHSTVFDEYGSDHSSEIHIDGRIVLNVWRIMRKEVTLNRYSFENVFYHVLHQRIPLYSFETLTAWYSGKYCMKQRVFDYYAIRTWGTAKLLDQLDVVARTSELARVFGIQFYDVLNRGSQFRVESMMLRSTKSSNYIPVSPTIRQRSSSRAPECIPLIMEPESRFYTDPVVVLDFQSLYPSMIIAYNYCFSTCLGQIEHLGKNTPFQFGCTSLNIPRKLLQKLKGNIHFSPTGIAFVKSAVRQGILPQLLNEILTTRIMVKQSMKQGSTDKTLKKLLDARQLGLKLIANVTYGYTSANYSGRMPCVEVADSIVGKARETLERAIHLVEDNPKWKARVVYGDTDSMFVLLPGRSKDQAFKIGQEIADVVTQANPKPVKLKFEKVYLPCVLQAKKHYVGYMYETPDQKDPIYDAKGIETVRRDTCPAVAKILEKSLKILFDTHDISLVKMYVQKQFSKLLSGRASIIDCIFAKEYHGLGGYRPGACVPALEIAKRRLRKDPRSEPRVGERVPYVIIYGFPTQPLIQLVKEPEELLKDKGLHINSKYYITRVIIPPLDRVFSLISIDVRTWYANMPHLHTPSLLVAPVTNQAKGRTLSQYFTALNCPVCDHPTNLGICSSCQRDPQMTCVILNDKVRRWERKCYNLNKICASCAKSRDSEDLCLSIDCPVMFQLNHAKRDLSQAPYIRNVLMLDFF